MRKESPELIGVEINNKPISPRTKYNNEKMELLTAFRRHDPAFYINQGHLVTNH